MTETPEMPEIEQDDDLEDALPSVKISADGRSHNGVTRLRFASPSGVTIKIKVPQEDSGEQWRELEALIGALPRGCVVVVERLAEERNRALGGNHDG